MRNASFAVSRATPPTSDTRGMRLYQVSVAQATTLRRRTKQPKRPAVAEATLRLL